VVCLHGLFGGLTMGNCETVIRKQPSKTVQVLDLRANQICLRQISFTPPARPIYSPLLTDLGRSTEINRAGK
jgi:hypothetical protein